MKHLKVLQIRQQHGEKATEAIDRLDNAYWESEMQDNNSQMYYSLLMVNAVTDERILVELHKQLEHYANRPDDV